MDEVVFVRFCEDRGLTKLDRLFDVAASEPSQVASRFQKLIRDYEGIFNASLFDAELARRLQPDASVLQAIIAQAVEFYKFDLLDVNLLGRIYELYLSYDLRANTGGLFYDIQLEERKQQGVYYTPSDIVDYLVSRCFRAFEDSQQRPVTCALDLACGSGVFLTSLFGEFLRHAPSAQFHEKRAILQDAVYGIDIDERAVHRAAQALYYVLLTGTGAPVDAHPLPDLRTRNLCVRDTILARHDLVPGKRFDVIVSNPPYLRFGGEQLAQYRQVYVGLLRGAPDLCWLMLVAGIDNLEDGGILGMVMPDNVLRAREASLIRQYVLDHTRIVEVSYLNYQPFPSATLQSVLLVLQKESGAAARQSNQVQVNYFATAGVFDHEASETVPQAAFASKSRDYVFNVRLTPEVEALYGKLTLSGETVDRHFRITQGIKADPASLRHHPTGPDSRKYIFGKDIQPYGVKWSGAYIDYNLDSPRTANARLRTANWFNVPCKVVVRQIVGDRIVAAIDDDAYFVDSTAFVLLPRAGTPDLVVYMALAFLGSRIARFCHQVKYPDWRAVFPRIRRTDIVALPLPSPSVMDEQLLGAIASEARHLSVLVGEGGSSGFAVYRTAQAARIEDLLAQAFGLTDAEQALINAHVER